MRHPCAFPLIFFSRLPPNFSFCQSATATKSRPLWSLAHCQIVCYVPVRLTRSCLVNLPRIPIPWSDLAYLPVPPGCLVFGYSDDKVSFPVLVSVNYGAWPDLAPIQRLSTLPQPRIVSSANSSNCCAPDVLHFGCARCPLYLQFQ